MNIIMAGDCRVIDGFKLVIYSTMYHTKESINWYILTMGIGCQVGAQFRDMHPITEHERELRKIIKYFDEKSDLKIIDCGREYEDIFGGNPNESSGFTPFACLRLLIDILIPTIDGALYLDTDIAVQSDLSDMYHHYLSMDVPYCAYIDHIANNHEGEMVSGILVLNMAEIRKSGLLEKARKNYVSHQYKYPDQMALRDTGIEPYPLDRTYNFMYNLANIDYKPSIIHFAIELVDYKIYDIGSHKFYRKFEFLQYVRDGLKFIENLNFEV